MREIKEKEEKYVILWKMCRREKKEKENYKKT